MERRDASTMSERPVLLVAGARPNFMKVAPVIAELDRAGRPAVLVHTGQHYDPLLSEDIFRDIGLRTPDYHLGVGSGSHARQTARVMETFEPVLLESRPEWLVLVGDVNSTLACALVGAKLKYELDCRIAHVEAGLRSFDWRMPEEVNRVVTDRLSDVLFTHSRDAHANLALEGIDPERVVFVGNVMVDTLFNCLPRARALDAPAALGVPHGKYVLATLHRPSNVDDRDSLAAILDGLHLVAAESVVVLPAHPRTRTNIARFGLQLDEQRVRIIDPVPYLEMLSLTDSSQVVLTDSGGLQEETTAIGIPCVTLREQTERPVTISHGTNALATWPLTAEGIFRAFQAARARGRAPAGTRVPDGWDGNASSRIVTRLLAGGARDNAPPATDHYVGSPPQPPPPPIR